MKKSIRTQLIFIWIGVVAGIFAVTFLATYFFLEPYYTSQKVTMVKRAESFLLEGEREDRLEEEAFQEELNSLSKRNNISFLVIDSSGEVKLRTSGDVDKERFTLYGFLFDMEGEKRGGELEKRDGDAVLRRRKDPKSKFEFVEVLGSLDNGWSYVLQTPVESLRDSASVTMRFMAIILLAAAAVAAVLIYFVSGRITRPIRELTHLSKRMAELDFNARFEGEEQDEIGQLGQHMNEMSEKLEDTISELKTANSELQRDIESKIQIDEMRKEFLANVSHELKTPIALIQGYAEGLEECVNDDEESRAFYCDVIKDEAEKMNLMVQKLLTLNSIEFGDMDVTLERFDIDQLLLDAIVEAKILADKEDITIQYAADGPLYVWSDEFQLREVVMNYLSNAIHYCKGEKIIEVKTEQREGTLRVSVFNTGDPIPEEHLDKLWVKFYKVDKARTREYGGSGIGLSIVKAIMDRIGQDCGVINYENGVEFWFEADMKA